MVPGSIFRYGSSFLTDTLSPLHLSRRPSDAAVIPFPRPDTTPPVTNTYFAAMLLLLYFTTGRIGIPRAAR